jgi:arylsulfatase A-like enzyme
MIVSPPAIMQAVDETVQKVYKALLDNNIANNTVLWFLSDNGGPYNLPGTFTFVP